MPKKHLSRIEKLALSVVLVVLGMAIFVAFQNSQSEKKASLESINIVLDLVQDYYERNGEHYASIAGLTEEKYFHLGSESEGCSMTCGEITTQSTCVDLNGITESDFVVDSDLYLMRSSEDEIIVGSCEFEFELSQASE